MKGSRLCRTCLRQNRSRLLQIQQYRPFIATRISFPSTRIQACGRLSFSTSTPRYSSNPVSPEPRARQKIRRKPLVITIAALALLAAGWYALKGSVHQDGSLDTTKFTPFNIISKEQISPTAFILTIRCEDSALFSNIEKVRAAWAYGLWSVEIKQPQLQIARRYTPLPPRDSGEERNGELRFLIRKLDGGEVSSYLSRLQIGDKIWLRGPHYGFNIAARLGDRDKLVFLAGGTGITPALQIAHRLLDSADNVSKRESPSVRILWANRRAVDCAGRDVRPNGSSPAGNVDTKASSLRELILDLKLRHGDRFQIRYFVDEEKSFIGPREIDEAMGYAPDSRSRPDSSFDGRRACRWHSPELLVSSSDEDDWAQTENATCTCPHGASEASAGRNLVCVSGPDGFIQWYAGAKRWQGGREIQGPVGLLLGSMLKRSRIMADEWLVLKM